MPLHEATVFFQLGHPDQRNGAGRVISPALLEQPGVSQYGPVDRRQADCQLKADWVAHRRGRLGLGCVLWPLNWLALGQVAKWVTISARMADAG